MYDIQEYVTREGRVPFAEWILSLKDKIVLQRVRSRIKRAEYGNFGDWKSLADSGGVFEMRDHYGAGTRIYYSFVGQTIILLLAGSDKGDQNRMIEKAKEYLADYKRRTEG